MFKILKKEELSPNVYAMEIDAPRVAKKAEPGQFIVLRVNEEGERIPLTIANFDRETGRILIVFQVIGASTMELAALNEGDSVLDFVGPLGRPSEIGKLAQETAETVEKIQQTIQAVQTAFAGLSGDAKAILGFLSDTVTPQYETFVKVAEQYGTDAETFRKVAEHIAATSRQVNETMTQVSGAIEQIANSAQDTAELSSQVSNAVDQVSGSVEDVNTMSQQQSAAAKDLHEVVSHFRLKK